MLGVDMEELKQEKERVNRCLLFMWLILLLTNVVMICIGTIYMTDMQERLNVLEQQTHHQSGNDWIVTNGEDKTSGKMGEKLRVKRQPVLENEELEHQMSGQHGIASHDIALLYGDPDQIPVDSNETDVFKRWNSYPGKFCDQIYRRNDNQLFCELSDPHHSPPLYMTSNFNTQYQYFKKAGWMNINSSLENYELTSDGGVVVKKSGLYIVHASVFFSKLDKRDRPSFGVFKKDVSQHNIQLVTKCLAPVNNHGRHDKTVDAPCQAWQLMHLDKGDQVYMVIGGYSWFRVDKESLHLALIKLNDDPL